METKTYLQISDHLKPGDLLLCSGNSPLSQIIREVTNSHYSHVGMLLPLKKTGQWLVLESVESKGVRCVTLQEGYLKNYCGTGVTYPGEVYIARYQNFPSDDVCLTKVYQQAFSLLGDDYNNDEIAAIAERIVKHTIGISNEGVLLPGNKFICSEYVFTCFKAAGIHLGFNNQGFIAPADIASNPSVDLLYLLEGESRV